MNWEEQGSRNLDLSESFFQRLVDDPSEMESLPDGANVVLLPDGDPELAEANLQLAARLTMQGQEQRDEEAPSGVSLKPSKSLAHHDRAAG